MFARRIVDRLNPIVVKEIRQTLRGRPFGIWLTLLLVAAAATGMIAAEMAEEAGSPRLGLEIALACLGFLNLLIITQIPLSVYQSLTAERDDGTLELVNITSLEATQIARGKILAAMTLAAIYTAALVPFLGFTYFLRGIDVFSLLLIVFLTLLASLLLATAGLAFAMVVQTKPGRRAFAGLFGMALVVLSGLGVILAWGVVEAQMAQELLRLFDADGAWLVVLAVLFGYVSLLGLFYSIGVGRLRFASANRARPVRLVLLAQWAGVLLMTYLVWDDQGRSPLTLIPLTIFVALYWFVVGVTSLWQDEPVSRRIYLPWSRRPRELRWLSSLLLPGQARAYVLFTFIVATTAAFFAWLAARSTSGSFILRDQDFVTFCILAFAYAHVYVTLPFVLMGGRLAEKSPLQAALVACIVPLLGAAAPFFFALFSEAAVSTKMPLFWVSPILGVMHAVDEGVDVLGYVLGADVVLMVAAAIILVRRLPVRPIPAVAPAQSHV